MKENLLGAIPEKVIHLELYVDESKERKYNNSFITYIMIMAIPTIKRDDLYNEINNARCLKNEGKQFDACIDNCKYHVLNNKEIHYSEIGNNGVLFQISDKWLDILLNNNLMNKGAIYFNILGINETNLDVELFGDKNQIANIYCRFFRTALLRMLKMFDKYDKIIIDHIYHDQTTEMESHSYFKTSAIRNIVLKEISNEERKVYFSTSEIQFIDSNHLKNNLKESQFIQFVDLVLGCVTNVIHNTATNNNKILLTKKIYPLVSRILDVKGNHNANSRYNYYNKQIISFFPKYTFMMLKERYPNIPDKQVEEILHRPSNFENTKHLLFKIDDGQQSLF